MFLPQVLPLLSSVTLLAVQVFRWTPGQHNLAELSSNSCDGAENAALLADITATPAEVQLSLPGTRNFTCSLSGKCAAGMLVQVVVYDGPVPAESGQVPSLHVRVTALISADKPSGALSHVTVITYAAGYTKAVDSPDFALSQL